jgi:hypothetical protein
MANPIRRLPGRGVVKEATYQARINPPPVPSRAVLRADALSLYRRIIRVLRRAPPSSARDDSYKHARAEFERNRFASDDVSPT